MDWLEATDIDTEEDFQIVENIITSLKKISNNPYLVQNLHHLD